MLPVDSGFRIYPKSAFSWGNSMQSQAIHDISLLVKKLQYAMTSSPVLLADFLNKYSLFQL